MPTTKLRCRCHPGYTCSAPLHGTIKIVNCGKNCGLGCANGSGKRQKNRE